MTFEIENYRAAAEERKEFVKGARVRHFLFGEGVIQSTKRIFNGLGHEGLEAEVLFEDGNTKIIRVTNLPLDKLSVV